MNTSEKLLYVVAGTGIGAALGILLAPRSGRELRNSISTQAQRGVDMVVGKMDEGRKFVQEKAAPTVRTMVEHGKQTLTDSVENVKSRVNESIEAGREEFLNQRREPRERGVL